MRKYIIVAGLITLFSISAFISILYHSLIPMPEREIALVSASTTIPSTLPVTSPSISPSKSPGSPISVPSPKTPRLSIPSLTIDAMMESVGVNDKGNMASPKSFQTVGWYKYGPFPGQPGTAIIDGHVNNGLSLKGVFTNLGNIEIGSLISITDSEGQTVDFRVEATSTADYTSHLEDIMVDSDEGSHIILITCEGKWISSQKTYDKRLIVLAERI